jgi:hypothetical protein
MSTDVSSQNPEVNICLSKAACYLIQQTNISLNLHVDIPTETALWQITHGVVVKFYGKKPLQEPKRKS